MDDLLAEYGLDLGQHPQAYVGQGVLFNNGVDNALVGHLCVQGRDVHWVGCGDVFAGVQACGSEAVVGLLDGRLLEMLGRPDGWGDRLDELFVEVTFASINVRADGLGRSLTVFDVEAAYEINVSILVPGNLLFNFKLANMVSNSLGFVFWLVGVSPRRRHALKLLPED